MAFLRAKEDEDIQFQMAPMIDVVFLLLIFFLIATSFINPETKLQTDLPQKQEVLEEELKPKQFIVVVTEDGIEVNKKKIGKRAFIMKVVRLKQTGENVFVFVDSTDDARHQDVIEILDALTMADVDVTVVPPYEVVE